jgi:hypothetical protein
MAEVDKGQLYTRYHALSVRKEIRVSSLDSAPRNVGTEERNH